MATIVGSSEVTLLAVTSGGDLVGTIGSFVFEGALEVTYWIDRAAWGQGIATRALDLFLDVVAERPLHARAASDNAGSLRVLHKAGFRIVGSAVSFAPARGVEIEEKILRLDDGQGP
ncbi:MAG: GNAT family N-acetyltransferase [Nocardioidaceae bacterium]